MRRNNFGSDEIRTGLQDQLRNLVSQVPASFSHRLDEFHQEVASGYTLFKALLDSLYQQRSKM